MPGASLERIRNLIGTSLATQESVPAAFGVLAVFGDDPWEACLAAASQGGDSDTIAAMVGAVAGACTGIGGFPAAAVDTVRKVNRLHLGPARRPAAGAADVSGGVASGRSHPGRG